MYCTHCGTQNPDEAKYCHHCGLGVFSGTPAAPVAYAGFWRRFVAYILDRLFLAIPTAVLVIAFIVPSIIGIVSGICHPGHLIYSIFTFILGWIWMIVLIVAGHLLYFVWFESSRYQATPGKMLLGIVVTDVYGQRITFLRSLGRNLGKIFSHMLFNIGFILAGITPRKQALHDLLADCLVVKKP